MYSEKVEAIYEVLEKIYRNHDIPFYPSVLRMTAQVLLEKLEVIDEEFQVMLKEKDLETVEKVPF